MMGASLVPRSWWGSFGAMEVVAAAVVVVGAASRCLALLPFARRRLFAPVALSDVDGMILYGGKTYQDKKPTSSYFYCLHNQLTMLIS